MIKILQATTCGGNREDFMPWYSSFFLVDGGDSLKFDEPIFAKMQQGVDDEDYTHAHVNDAIKQMEAHGYVVTPMDEPIYIHAEEF